MTPTTTTLVLALATGTAKATVLLALAWGAARLLRRSAAGRHLVWILGAAAVVVLPALGLLVPSVALPLPALLTDGLAARAEAASPAVRAAAGTANAAEVEVVERALEDERRAALRTGSPTAFEPGSPAEAPAEGGITTGLLPWLLALYAGGVALVLLPWGLGLVGRRRLAGRATDLDHPAWQRDLARLRRELGIRRPVRLLASDRQLVPMTWGLLRPVVLLPRGAGDWEAGRRTSVLAHELAHVARLDMLGLALGRAALALYWFHPLAWLAARRIESEAERAADDRVLSTEAAPKPSLYARHLLEVARLLAGPDARPALVPVLGMARESELTRRIGSILDPASRRGPLRARSGAVAVLGALLLATGLATVSCTGEAEAHRAEIELTLGPGPGGYFDQAREAGDCSPGFLGDWRRGTQIEIHDDDWQVTLREGSCRLDADWEGAVGFTADERGVAFSGPGRFTLEEMTDHGTVRLVATPGPDGATRYETSGAGEPDTLLAAAIPALLRATGFRADERVARIYAASGSGGVLEEIERIGGDSVERLYFEALFGLEEFPNAELARALRAAGDALGSDLELRQVLAAVPADSLGVPEVDAAWAEAARSIGSDFELREALVHRLGEGPVRPEVAAPVIALGHEIGSDFDTTELLVHATRVIEPDARLPEEYFAVARGIGSDFEQRRVLVAAIDRGSLDSGSIDTILTTTRQIDSDFERRTVLVHLAETADLTGPSRAAYLDEANALGSEYERSQALRAVGEG